VEGYFLQKGHGVNTLPLHENLPVAGIKMERRIVGFQKADYTCSIFSKKPAKGGRSWSVKKAEKQGRTVIH